MLYTKNSNVLKRQDSMKVSCEVIVKFTYHVTVGKETGKTSIKVAVNGAKLANSKYTLNVVL